METLKIYSNSLYIRIIRQIVPSIVLSIVLIVHYLDPPCGGLCLGFSGLFEGEEVQSSLPLCFSGAEVCIEFVFYLLMGLAGYASWQSQSTSQTWVDLMGEYRIR